MTKTVAARYEVGVPGDVLDFYCTFREAQKHVVEGGYIFDRMARAGRAELWECENGDLRIKRTKPQKEIKTRKTKTGVIIYQGKELDMYEFSLFRIANKLSHPHDVTPVNVKRFLAQRAANGACSLCGSDISKTTGLCLRGCKAKRRQR